MTTTTETALDGLGSYRFGWADADAYAADAPAITSQIGRRALDELLAAHRLWTQWLASGRVRKIAVVAERPAEE